LFHTSCGIAALCFLLSTFLAPAGFLHDLALVDPITSSYTDLISGSFGGYYPSPRYSAGVVGISALGLVYVFGGASLSGFHFILCLYSGVLDTQLTPRNIIPPGAYLNDLYQWDEATLFWRECVQANRISHRVSSGAASLQGKLYIFGGNGGLKRLNDLQAWDPATSSWTEINATTPAPAPREGHGFVSIESMRKLYVLGGVVNVSGEDRISSEFYEFDLYTSKWSNITHLNTLSARSHFGFTSGNDKLYVFGGISDRNASCALFEFDTVIATWQCASASGSSGFLQSFHILPGLAFSGSRLYISGGVKSSGA
jgi:hypothetical protein